MSLKGKGTTMILKCAGVNWHCLPLNTNIQMQHNMVTRDNYAQTVKSFGYENLNDSLKEDYDSLNEATSNFTNWVVYINDEKYREYINRAFKELEKYILAHTGKKNQKADKKQNKQGAGEKKQKPHKEKHEKKPEAGVHYVEQMDEQVKFIRRFVGLHNRKKPFKAFLNLLKAIQKAIVQRIIRKSSSYAHHIEQIQQNLVKACNQGKEIIHMMISEKDLPELVAIAGGEKVYPSIGIIKRYIGMEGRTVKKEKRLAFIKQIENAIKKGKFNEDPYHEKVKEIVSELKKLKSDKTAIKIGAAELNGLKGIAHKCGCSSLGRIYNTKGKKLRRCGRGTYSDAKRQGACSHNRGLAGIMSAEEVLNQEYEMLPFTGIWKRLFGKPAKNFTLLLHGGPGAGKTTFMMLFVKFLSSLGNVLYISSEEYGASTLKQKIQEYLTPTPSNVFFTADKAKIDQAEYDFVVLDSVTNIGMDIEEFKKLKEAHPETGFIVLLQHTKQGQFRGSKEWEHETEMAGEVVEGTITVYRNRYGVMGEWYFFDKGEKALDYDQDDTTEEEDEQYSF
jgi:hypothetical protein